MWVRKLSDGDQVAVHDLVFRYYGWDGRCARFDVEHVGQVIDYCNLAHGERYGRDDLEGVTLTVKRIDGDTKLYIDAPRRVQLRLVS